MLHIDGKVLVCLYHHIFVLEGLLLSSLALLHETGVTQFPIIEKSQGVNDSKGISIWNVILRIFNMKRMYETLPTFEPNLLSSVMCWGRLFL